VAEFLADLAKQKKARLLVKVKSMTTEEIDLNEHLAEQNLEIVETDLGEFIVQIAHSRPYHIVAPALNLTRYDVADLFTKTLGVPRETDPEKQCKIARGVLREKFLAADIGVSGANFLVADSGAIVTVTNEATAGCAPPCQGARRHRRHREADSAGAGPGRFSEAAGPQRHRAAVDGLHHFISGPGAPARSTAPKNFTWCCWMAAARACWPTARSASRCTASAAAPASTTAGLPQDRRA